MTRTGRIVVCAYCVALVLAVTVPPAHAGGTTVIVVKTEGAGDIIKYAGNRRNLNGAMVWNGSEWVVNNTWAHKYFVIKETGERLKNYTSHDANVTCTASAVDRPDGYGDYVETQTITDSAGKTYAVTARDYWYTKLATSGTCGSYHYGSLEYTIRDNTTEKEVILRSRGVGEGTGQAYFDVYIDDEAGSGSAAFCNDPAWFTYAVPASQALGEACGSTGSRTGDLPGAVATQSSHYGDYYLDIGGGSDMGGKSFELHTGPLDSRLRKLSESYVTSFEMKFMDGNGNLQRIMVSPCLLRETFTPGECPATSQAPVLVWPVLLVLAALLAGAGGVCLRYRRAG